MWYPAVRPALFAIDPERAHRLALNAARLLGQRTPKLRGTTPIQCLGLELPNRIGLAAGFDKNAVAVDGLGSFGFGFIEVGTVTPQPQSGQPRPRLFRVPAGGALINRLGFPNEGAAKVVVRLQRRRYRGVVGVNIGKNAGTPLSRAIDDYVACLRTVRTVADYLVVNVSSPNTVGLRDLQAREHLEPLLTALLEENRAGAARNPRPPLLVKISPDLSHGELKDLASLLQKLPVDGVVATNTTVSHVNLRANLAGHTGGISGRPLQSIATATVKKLREFLGATFPIIGVGGIDSPQAALAMRAAGADLIQLYTGLVYHGPSLVTKCVRALG